MAKLFRMKITPTMQFAQIPMQWVGPFQLTGDIIATVEAPMATYETPLWPSVNRGSCVHPQL
jgi:hydroxymethylglutaryl-CoA reductase (NADPH)